MIHELKLNTIYFEEALKGNKPFEIRYNDRDYKVGDEIVLKEWDKDYTGREIYGRITYMIPSDFRGLALGYVAFTYEIGKIYTKTDKFNSMIEGFESDFNLAVKGFSDLSALDEIINDKDDPRHERLLADIDLLAELSYLLRYGKAEIHLIEEARYE